MRKIVASITNERKKEGKNERTSFAFAAIIIIVADSDADADVDVDVVNVAPLARNEKTSFNFFEIFRTFCKNGERERLKKIFLPGSDGPDLKIATFVEVFFFRSDLSKTCTYLRGEKVWKKKK